MGDEKKYKMDWTRQPGEPQQWYSRFHVYLTLGPTRTYLGAYKAWNALSKTKKPVTCESAPEGWRVKAKRWNWKERAEMYDATIQQQERDELEATRKEFLKKKLEAAMQMTEKGSQVISMPHERTIKTERDGKEIIVHQPINFSMGDGIKLITEGLSLGDEIFDPTKKGGSYPTDEVGEDRPEHELAYDWFTDFTDVDTDDGKSGQHDDPGDED